MAAKKSLPKKSAPAKKPAASKKSHVKKSPSPAAPAKKKAPAKSAAPVAKVAKTASSTKKPTSQASGTKSVSSLKPAPAASKKSSPPVGAPAPVVSKTKSTSVSSSSGKPKPTAKAATKAKARDALRSRVLGRTKAAKSIAFSLDEVKEIAKTSAEREAEEATTKAAKTADKKAQIEASLKSAKPAVVGAASLADILGFNPLGGHKAAAEDPNKVAEKFRRYYKLLLELRDHLTGQIDQHSEETLKRSSKDDAGDLSSYGQHMADAGTDTFDRDFALSLVANEQEALSEIEAAINRIKNGTYGNCEVTGKPIAKERLMAVPFTRYSAEAQKQIERNRHRVRTQAGLFGEFGEEGGTISDGGDDD